MGNVWRPTINLAIEQLTPEHSHLLSAMLVSQSPKYTQYFVPFSYDHQSIHERLANAQSDKYWGMWCNRELAGFFMLRGFDEGYMRPSYGVLISEPYANKGLAKLTLTHALSWCRLNQLEAIMLKVHPDNIYAKRAYEKMGFQHIEPCPRTGHLIMEVSWN